MTGAALAEKTPLERRIQSWGGLFGAAGAGGAAAFLQGQRFSRVAADAPADAAWEDDEERWEAGLRQQNAANDELCSKNGRLRAEIERLRAEEEAAADASASAGGGGAGEAEEPAEAGAAGAPEDEEEEELLEAVGAAVWEVLAQWPSVPIGVEPTLGSEDATDGEEPAVESAVAAAAGGEEAAEAAAALAAPASEGGEAGGAGVEEEEKEEELDKDGVDDEAAEKEEVTTTTSEEAAAQPSVSGVASPDGEWQGGVVATVEAAVRAALHEATSSTTPEPALSPAEETAVLVAEKIALRELVERQQEKLETLETQLQEAGAALPLGATALGGALAPVGGALGSGIARGFHDASGALSAGLSAVLAPKVTKNIAEVGVEYEVVGRKGTIVRSEESLRSEQIADLPPGTRVRVVSISEKYPRRVEIVAVQASASTAGVAADLVGAEDGRADTAPTGGAAADAAAPAADAECAPKELPTPRAPIVGWISASTKDGILLIQPVPSEPGPAATSSSVGEAGSAELESREEGNEEVAQVTLSSVEWECLHRDREASLRRVEALTSKLNETGRELLQSFEMRSVLGELQLGVGRAHERSERMRETAALACEELEQRRAQHRLEAHHRQGGGQRQRRGLQPRPEADSEIEGSGWEEATSSPSSSGAPRGDSCGGTTAAATSSSAPGSQGPSRRVAESRMLEAVDWDRLLSERETTAAALSAALRRAACLEREAAELQAEREAAERCSRDELQRLREKLRRAAKPDAPAGPSQPPLFQGPGPPSASSAAGGLPGGEAASSSALCAAGFPCGDGLFRRCVEDLQHTVSGLKLELRRASASEVALRRSVEARSSALRTLLHRGATAGLSAVQCGPLKLPASAEAERRALVLAVEEQLRFNLLLRSSRERQGGGSPGSSQRPAESRRSSGHVDRPAGPKYTMLNSFDSDSA